MCFQQTKLDISKSINTFSQSRAVSQNLANMLNVNGVGKRHAEAYNNLAHRKHRLSKSTLIIAVWNEITTYSFENIFVNVLRITCKYVSVLNLLDCN